ncbi:CPCC family cysteine-rich protein [Stigmatella aurantiaca]|uniref:Cysteine-rich CPCC domain-containing protein n=2 Tax=Stigmatella aurantiaca (strain DW4/3-1) TaxID=378806 RepID=E3FZE1_STIAD|nr:CPCC family cysteine-rich protein [Stigmatella aurantiaca]ADO76142.1 uncharacterized protein STAUR_8388 [Stigmatella aurantiaca DW4/3-1]
MRREVLIRLIAREVVARRPPHEKLAELPAYWGWDEVSPGWERLSPRVREEMLEREDAAPRLWRSHYDAFFEFVEEDARRIVRNEALRTEALALGLSVEAVEGTPDAAEPCPCCGYRTFEWRGEHDLCPVCGWEDEEGEDAIDDGPERLKRFSVAHQMTRAEYRRAYEARRDAELREGRPEVLRKYERFASKESRPRLIPRAD